MGVRKYLSVCDWVKAVSNPRRRLNALYPLFVTDIEDPSGRRASPTGGTSKPAKTDKEITLDFTAAFPF